MGNQSSDTFLVSTYEETDVFKRTYQLGETFKKKIYIYISGFLKCIYREDDVKEFGFNLAMGNE